MNMANTPEDESAGNFAIIYLKQVAKKDIPCFAGSIAWHHMALAPADSIIIRYALMQDKILLQFLFRIDVVL